MMEVGTIHCNHYLYFSHVVCLCLSQIISRHVAIWFWFGWLCACLNTKVPLFSTAYGLPFHLWKRVLPGAGEPQLQRAAA
jgi:hypothetical protein